MKRTNETKSRVVMSADKGKVFFIVPYDGQMAVKATVRHLAPLGMISMDKSEHFGVSLVGVGTVPDDTHDGSHGYGHVTPPHAIGRSGKDRELTRSAIAFDES